MVARMLVVSLGLAPASMYGEVLTGAEFTFCLCYADVMYISVLGRIRANGSPRGMLLLSFNLTFVAE